MKKRFGLPLVFILGLMFSAFCLHSVSKPYQPKVYIPKQPGIQLHQPDGAKAAEENDWENEGASWTLPASLQVIDDEAFEGTAIQYLELPETVTTVGDRAFADNDELMLVSISGDLQHMGDDVFAGSGNAFLEVLAGSGTMDRAAEKGYRVLVASAVTKRRINSRPPVMTAGLRLEIRYEQKRNICSAEAEEKQTGRTEADLKEERYSGTVSLYVRSRYFP